MKRTTISLPDALANRVEREARRRRVSVSQVTREALESRFGGGTPRTLPFIALGRSGKPSIARNVDEALEAEGFPDSGR